MADNKTVVRRLFEEVVNQGALAVTGELLDPEFEATMPTGSMNVDGFKEFVTGWRAGFSDLHCDVRELIAEGDTVAWSVWCTGTNDGDFMGIPATGRTIAFNSVNIAHLRDGRVYRHTGMLDMLGMMQQLGVPAGVS
jgi:steroid delta-isomerase-like uncharacterized protein